MNMEKEIKRRAFCSLIGAFIILAIINGTYTTFSVYVGDLCSRLDASVVQVMIMFTVCSVTSMIVNLLIAASLLKNVSVKIRTLAGSVCFLAFFMLVRFAESLTMLYIAGILLGVATVLGGLTTLQPIIGWWYAKGLGKKYSILSLSYPLFGIVLSATIPHLLLSAGFDNTTLIYGVIVSVIAIICSVTMMSDRPEKYGLKPYGYQEHENKTDIITDADAHDMDFRQIARTRPFWLLLVSPFFITIALVGYTSNASTFYQSTGLSPTQAGMMMSVYGIDAMAFTMLYGIIADRLSPRTACTIYGVTSTAAFALAAVMSGQTACMIFAILVGTINYVDLIVPTNAVRIYGASALSVIIPTIMISCSIGAMLGPPLAGFIYDHTGSYSLFMVCAAVLCMLAFIAVLKATSEETVQQTRCKMKESII